MLTRRDASRKNPVTGASVTGFEYPESLLHPIPFQTENKRDGDGDNGSADKGNAE